MTNKTITLELVGLDGNAFFLMGAFSRQARREGWTQEEIDEVLIDCKSGDYDHLLQVLVKHCVSPSPDAENEDFAEWDDHAEEDLDHFDEDELEI